MEGSSTSYTESIIKFRWPEELRKMMAAFILVVTVIILLIIWPLFSGKQIKLPVAGGMEYFVLITMIAMLFAILYMRGRYKKFNEDMNTVLNFLYEYEGKKTAVEIESGLKNKTKNSVQQVLNVLSAKDYIRISTSEDGKTTVYEAIE